MLRESLDATKLECEEVQTKNGKAYTNEIRSLYYSLLSQNIPANKLEKLVKTVLHTFRPDVDTAKLQLPKASIDARMRSDELPTVSKAHQAAVLSAADSYHLNSDGTILNQHKVC